MTEKDPFENQLEQAGKTLRKAHQQFYERSIRHNVEYQVSGTMFVSPSKTSIIAVALGNALAPVFLILLAHADALQGTSLISTVLVLLSMLVMAAINVLCFILALGFISSQISSRPLARSRSLEGLKTRIAFKDRLKLDIRKTDEHYQAVITRKFSSLQVNQKGRRRIINTNPIPEKASAVINLSQDIETASDQTVRIQQLITQLTSEGKQLESTHDEYAARYLQEAFAAMDKAQEEQSERSLKKSIRHRRHKRISRKGDTAVINTLKQLAHETQTNQRHDEILAKDVDALVQETLAQGHQMSVGSHE
jgi:hypothetical protein